MFPRTTSHFSLLLALCAGVSLPAHALDGLGFFENKVRPLLVEHCLDCHSVDKKVKGGLRLDTREGWAEGGDSGPAIVPGDPDKSLFITAVRYTDVDLKMPEKRKLPAEQIAILEQWVAMGAPDPRSAVKTAKKQTGMDLETGKKFWCYASVQTPVVPTVRNTQWPRNEIDHFVLSRMEAQNIHPAPDAEPEVLLRRLTYNLIGLPPTPSQIDDFKEATQKDRAGAFAALVDELLASPRFGETWGRHWLDVARFAESSGGGRTLLFKDAWRYRDYVIESFNQDMPFDQFIREQVAGDLLPAATPAEKRRKITATAFLALGPTNYEEQDKQQLRFDVIDEQLETMGRAFLGQTIGCARCHDHKFDPIPQRDYYALAGIFASTRTLLNYTDNVARWVATPLPGDGEQEKALRAFEKDVAALEQEVESAKADLAQASKSIAEETSTPGKAIAPEELPGIVLDDTQAKVVGEWKNSQHVRSYVGNGYLHDLNEGKGEKTITFTPSLPTAGKYDVRLAYSYLAGRASNVRVNILHADGEDTIYVDQSVVPPLAGRFVSLGKYRFEKDGAGYVLISNEGTKGYVTVDALQFLPETEIAAAEDAKDNANPARAAASKKVKQLEAKLKKLKKEGPTRETAMAVMDADEASDAEIRVRGVEKQRGPSVPRGFLRVAMNATPSFSTSESGRRELADWLASNENPLTARVFVNRVWTWLFGSGIVRTVDNFGTTGEKPSHPELLDHLASRFVAEGWSVKQLIRQLVLSRTWQQSVTPASAADPENRLFAHVNRRRFTAEQIRDTLLAVSGQLKLDYLGQNMAGAGDINANDFSAQNTEYGYVFADTRRSVYTPAFRNKRLELFEAFDFGDINATIGQRSVSTVAPQALYFLNHPFVMQQAQAAAKQLIAEPGSPETRIHMLFQQALGRKPTARELATCLRFVNADGPTAIESLDTWTQIQHAIFASVDFRYLD